MSHWCAFNPASRNVEFQVALTAFTDQWSAFTRASDPEATSVTFTISLYISAPRLTALSIPQPFYILLSKSIRLLQVSLCLAMQYLFKRS